LQGFDYVRGTQDVSACEELGSNATVITPVAIATAVIIRANPVLLISFFTTTLRP